jgi:predicted phosphodiesterase
MRISIVSDLHLEFSELDLDNSQNADVLVLSGDIMVAADLHDFASDSDPTVSYRARAAAQYRQFLQKCSQQFPHVIYVAGNHEFYRGKFHAGLDVLRDECAKYPNVYFLERETKIIDDVVFVGGTLWTDMNRGDPVTVYTVKNGMNDYRVIRNDQREYAVLRPSDTVERHRQTLSYIQSELAKYADRTCVVVGHHCPTQRSVHPTFVDQYHMNGGYHNELSGQILDHPQVALWTCGHTHHAHWYYVGNTLVVCNPRGYHQDGHGEQTGWNPNLVIDLAARPDPDYVQANYSNLT